MPEISNKYGIIIEQIWNYIGTFMEQILVLIGWASGGKPPGATIL